MLRNYERRQIVFAQEDNPITRSEFGRIVRKYTKRITILYNQTPAFKRPSTSHHCLVIKIKEAGIYRCSPLLCRRAYY